MYCYRLIIVSYIHYLRYYHHCGCFIVIPLRALYIRRKVSFKRSHVVKLKNIYVVNEDSCPQLYYSVKQVYNSINSLLIFFFVVIFIILPSLMLDL